MGLYLQTRQPSRHRKLINDRTINKMKMCSSRMINHKQQVISTSAMAACFVFWHPLVLVSGLIIAVGCYSFIGISLSLSHPLFLPPPLSLSLSLSLYAVDSVFSGEYPL